MTTEEDAGRMEAGEEVLEGEVEAWSETSDKSISWVCWCCNLEVLLTMKLTGQGGFKTGRRGWDENVSIVYAGCLV